MKRLSIGILVASLLQGCATLPSSVNSFGAKTDEVTFNFDIRIDEQRYGNRIAEIKRLSEKIPDYQQEAFNNQGGKIIVYDGNLTNLPEFSNLKNSIHYGRMTPYGKLPGIADLESNKIGIKVNYEHVPLRNVLMHELCHGIINTSFENPEKLNVFQHESFAKLCEYHYNFKLF